MSELKAGEYVGADGRVWGWRRSLMPHPCLEVAPAGGDGMGRLLCAEDSRAAAAALVALVDELESAGKKAQS